MMFVLTLLKSKKILSDKYYVSFPFYGIDFYTFFFLLLIQFRYRHSPLMRSHLICGLNKKKERSSLLFWSHLSTKNLSGDEIVTITFKRKFVRQVETAATTHRKKNESKKNTVIKTIFLRVNKKHINFII